MDPANRPFDVVGQLSSLRRYARSLVRNTSDADDLVQDALVKAYERQRSQLALVDPAQHAYRSLQISLRSTA
ncbi:MULTISPECIES: sigma factor [Rhizobium/Agrobacterium group]|uniref:sigma factor n=1 Tax=Rhizobium/Agrobacterium group TaxID=227290 RepID=UPI001FCD82F9|nr:MULTISPECIES: sigma factor [Rhizobium/Agrobacterium group]